MDLDKSTAEFFGRLVAMQSGASMYQTLAVILALAERRAVAPSAVARWADFFANNMPADHPEDMREQMAAQLKQFANLIRIMDQMPAGAGRG